MFRKSQLASVPSYDLKPWKLDPPLPEPPSSELSAILFRREYRFILKRLEDHWPNIGGVVVTGQPGIGTSLFTEGRGSPCSHTLLHLLSIGEPITLQRGEVFFLFCQNGVGMYDGNSAPRNETSTGFRGETLDSQIPIKIVCTHVNHFRGLVG